MIKISAIIICKNEERNIARCLKSLAGVADEIIVVDSGSTDKTLQIVKESGAKSYHHDFEGYGEQKNWANEKAGNDIILSLDADECLSTDLQKEIINLKQNWEGEAFLIRRKIYYCGQWIRFGAWNPDNKIRLWNRQQGCWNTPKVHEKVILQKGIQTFTLKAPIFHFTTTSLDAHIGQINRFSTLRAEELLEKNKKANLYQLFVKPSWKFIWAYFIKFGFLDGMHGYMIAKNSAFGHYLRYAKLNELRKGKNL